MLDQALDPAKRRRALPEGHTTGGTDGMGQDFTFNWFTQLGLRREILENVSLSGGVYFIHHSNLGMTDPNPGIDALGFSLGVGWGF